MSSAAAIATAIAVACCSGAVTGLDALQDFGGARPMLPVGALAILAAAAGLALAGGALGAPLVLGGAIALAGLLPCRQRNYRQCRRLRDPDRRRRCSCLRRHRNVADGCALVVALIAGLALLGYLFERPRAAARAASSPLTPMAVPTAFALLAPQRRGSWRRAREGWLIRPVEQPRSRRRRSFRRLAPAAMILPIVLAVS